MDLQEDRSSRTAVERISAERSIRDACMRYWAGVDQRDSELFASAFAPEAEISLRGRVIKVPDLMRQGLDGGFAHSSHSLASQSIIFDHPGTASVTSFAVAHLVAESGPIFVRGLKYDDVFVQVDDDWRIRRREHRTLWQYDANSVVPHIS